MSNKEKRRVEIEEVKERKKIRKKTLLYLDINWPLLFFPYGVKSTSTFKSSFNGLYAMPNYMH